MPEGDDDSRVEVQMYQKFRSQEQKDGKVDQDQDRVAGRDGGDEGGEDHEAGRHEGHHIGEEDISLSDVLGGGVQIWKPPNDGQQEEGDCQSNGDETDQEAQVEAGVLLTFDWTYCEAEKKFFV